MMLRRKLYLGALLGAILFLMIAAHTIQKASVVPITDLPTHHHLRIPMKNQTQLQTVVTEPRRGNSCSCPSCIADKGVSGWFDQRYDHKQQLYLTGRDDDIDPLSLKWWLSLQASDGVIKDVIQNMFKIISPPHENEMPQQKQCRKCAVVGNSGNLLKSKYGALIDSHPIVIRTYMRVKNRVEADKDKVMVVNPAFFKYTHDNWTERHGRYPSTGIVAIIFALHHCHEVSVFGYGADKKGSWHHYWEYNKYAGAFRKTGVHNADFETVIIQRLNKEGKIKLYR
ncbi:hypothetical protein cypCar_00000203 [Cyprinus carpio]|nr:hypothetical protein cypCar_00000203 [Cyprinus carpio]